MKVNIFYIQLVMILGCWVVQSQAEEDQQLAAIRELGNLNGIALHCGRLVETQRIKRELVPALPKRRQLGELFDYETNSSFLAAIDKKSACPSQQELDDQITEALVRLHAVYPAP